MGGHRCDMYFQDSVLGKRRYHHRPGRPPDLHRPNLRHPGLLRFYFEAYSLAFNVFEFPEGLLGDIDGILDEAGQEGQSNSATR